MKKYLINVLALGAVATSLNAGCVATNCSNVNVEDIIIGSTHALINTTGDESKLTCTAMYGRLRLRKDHASFQTIYSTLLAAQMSGNRVSIVSYPDASDNNYCTITYMYSLGK